MCPCLTASRLKEQEDKTLRIKDTSGLHLYRVRPSHSFTPSPPPSSPLPTSPLPPLSSSLSSSHLPSLPPPSSQVRLRPVVALWHAVSVAYLAAALAHSHSHSHSHSLTLSLSHCLTVSLISLISLISFSSLSSLSPLSLSLLSVSRLSVSLLSLLSQEDPGKEPHIKDSSPLPPKRAPCFFLPRCPPLSHSGALAFAPPLASSIYIYICIIYTVYIYHASVFVGPILGPVGCIPFLDDLRTKRPPFSCTRPVPVCTVSFQAWPRKRPTEADLQVA